MDFRDIFDSLSDRILFVNLDFTITQANQAAIDFYITKQPLPGKTCYEVFYDRDQLCENCSVSKVFQGIPYRNVVKDETKRWCELRCFPVKDKTTEKLIGATFVLKDIDEHKNEMLSLKKNEALLGTIFSCIQDSLYVIDTEYTVLYVNPRMESIFPEHHPITGKKCYTLVSNENVCEGCPVPLALKKGTSEPHSKIHHYPHAPGEPWKQGCSSEWRELIVYPIINPETGKIESLFNFVRDVTVQKNAEKSLENIRSHISVIADIRTMKFDDSEEESIRLFLNSAAKHFQLDYVRFVELQETKKNKTIINDSCFNILSSDKTQLNVSSQHLETYFPQEKEIHDFLWKAIHDFERRHFRQGDPGFSEEYCLASEAEDKCRIRSVLAVPYRKSDNISQGFVFYSRFFNFFDSTMIDYVESCVKELTRRIKEAQQWRIQQKKLEQAKNHAEKAMLVKSQFLANISHEIRTPINAILGYSELILQDNILPIRERLHSSETIDENSWNEATESAENAMRVILSNGQYLLAMINDILDYSKADLEKMHLEIIPVDFLALVQDIQAIHLLEARKKGIHFNVVYETDIPKLLYTDPVRLKQVLVNLLSNAIRFTLKGHVDFLISWCDFEETRYFSTNVSDESVGVLSVKIQDTGIGISEKSLKHLFKPFQQGDTSTTRHFGGTGLGLVIAKKITELMKSELSVQSNLDEGTTFSFDVKMRYRPSSGFAPAGNILTSLHADAKKKRPIGKNRFLLSGKRILIVEDGFDNRRLLLTILKKAGAEIIEAENGKEAVDVVQSGLLPDLIVMDMQMPIMDGYTASRILREKQYPGSIIALTANATLEDQQKCLEIGCDAYLSKPISREVLLECLAKQLKRM